MRRLVFAAIFCVGVLMSLSVCSIAQPKPTFRYAVKFICGKAEGKILSPGVYMTAINVHNPTDSTAVFKKKFATALPGETAGPVSDYFKSRLAPSEALEIDCADIIKHTRSRAGLLKGFVAIESKVMLEVVAVYTVADLRGEVKSLDVQDILPRRLGFVDCPDLIVEKVDVPEWDGENRRSVIRATIKNIGGAHAGPSIARVIDPTTLQPTEAPYNAVAATPALQPGERATVSFYLPYWVYNPDVTLEVTADYKNDLAECSEDNNVKVFKDIG